MSINFKEQLKHVKAFAFDVDGVFSGSQVILHPNGDMLRTSNIKDGYAVFHATKLGYPIAIITGGDSEVVKERFEKLGIKHVYLKSANKMEHFLDFLEKENLSAEDVLYMGDDIPDYPVMEKVGVPACPNDAAVEIKSISKYISQKNGGEGCVRDVLEQVLRAQNNWIHPESYSW